MDSQVSTHSNESKRVEQKCGGLATVGQSWWGWEDRARHPKFAAEPRADPVDGTERLSHGSSASWSKKLLTRDGLPADMWGRQIAEAGRSLRQVDR